MHASKSTGLRVAVQNQFFTVDSILGTVLSFFFFFHFTVSFLKTFETHNDFHCSNEKLGP